jgi:hypothetical protein
VIVSIDVEFDDLNPGQLPSFYRCSTSFQTPNSRDFAQRYHSAPEAIHRFSYDDESPKFAFIPALEVSWMVDWKTES